MKAYITYFTDYCDDQNNLREQYKICNVTTNRQKSIEDAYSIYIPQYYNKADDKVSFVLQEIDVPKEEYEILKDGIDKYISHRYYYYITVKKTLTKKCISLMNKINQNKYSLIYLDWYITYFETDELFEKLHMSFEKIIEKNEKRRLNKINPNTPKNKIIPKPNIQSVKPIEKTEKSIYNNISKKQQTETSSNSSWAYTFGLVLAALFLIFIGFIIGVSQG